MDALPLSRVAFTCKALGSAALQGMAMATRRKRTTARLAGKSLDLAIAVPIVMTHRLTRMALAGRAPSSRDRKEFDGMVKEKGAAFRASWSAMAMQAFRAQQALSVSLMTTFWTARPPTAKSLAARVRRDAVGILGKGIAPVHRKAVANARRLSRTKLR